MLKNTPEFGPEFERVGVYRETYFAKIWVYKEERLFQLASSRRALFPTIEQVCIFSRYQTSY